MIGPVRASKLVRNSKPYRELRTLANVHFLGRQPYESLPGYYHAFDVGLLPYLQNRWMHYSSPNKIYQYLAAGRPVVSTAFPEVKRYDQVIAVCDSKEDFVVEVEKAISSKDQQRIEAGREIARENSTERRAERLLKIMRQAVASHA